MPIEKMKIRTDAENTKLNQLKIEHSSINKTSTTLPDLLKRIEILERLNGLIDK